MAKYLIENIGGAVHPVTVRGEAVDILPGQGVVETLNQSEVKRLEHSVGLRLTLREDPAPEPAAAEAPPAKRRSRPVKAKPVQPAPEPEPTAEEAVVEDEAGKS